jgi:hypothetical protein
VSFVRPLEALAGDPADSTLDLCEQFVQQLIASVKSNPSNWKSTAIYHHAKCGHAACQG